jgi:hypothetical protein
MFKVGDLVRYAKSANLGTVLQVEGGRDGDLTEVHWPDYDNQAIWVKTKYLSSATK